MTETRDGPPEDLSTDTVDLASPWRVAARRTVFRNPWIAVVESDVEHRRSGPGRYTCVHFHNLAIGILPIDADGRVWLVGQYRFPHGAWSWELPEGGGDRGVPPIESAARELREETGLTARRWLPWLSMHLSNAVTDEHAICFLAWGLQHGEPEPDAGEIIEIRRLPFPDAIRAVEDGAITDAITIAALLKARLAYLEGTLPPEPAAALRRSYGEET